MVERLAHRIAVTIKNMNPTETTSIDVMKFSLIMIIGTGTSLFLSLVISSMFGYLNSTIWVLVSFMILRAFSGGFHFKSPELCMLTSIAGAVLIPLIKITSFMSVTISVATLVIFLLLAPIGINQSKFFTKRHYPILKLVSLGIVLLNVLIINSDLLAITFFAQSITILVTFVKGGDR